MVNGKIKTVSQMSDAEKQMLWGTDSKKEGYFLWWGGWDGPFNTEDEAKNVYRERMWDIH